MADSIDQQKHADLIQRMRTVRVPDEAVNIAVETFQHLISHIERLEGRVAALEARGGGGSAAGDVPTATDAPAKPDSPPPYR